MLNASILRRSVEIELSLAKSLEEAARVIPPVESQFSCGAEGNMDEGSSKDDVPLDLDERVLDSMYDRIVRPALPEGPVEFENEVMATWKLLRSLVAIAQEAIAVTQKLGYPSLSPFQFDSLERALVLAQTMQEE
eukprot:gnl/MRDRNA2_/MRDRNA2_129132_c0_seq1.p1 gnl/MRDRNA2_/MRDRNA2_129132_c0~~gnl/MRDRNA2_/MRDRNA2_129132_c0_seq1.p1  ORF type:complete len:135 (-),score=37.71 gnl/MRDRNA2_/MRDRNA2_129132_c0_seq1:327-731(-)